MSKTDKNKSGSIIHPDEQDIERLNTAAEKGYEEGLRKAGQVTRLRDTDRSEINDITLDLRKDGHSRMLHDEVIKSTLLKGHVRHCRIENKDRDPQFCVILSVGVDLHSLYSLDPNRRGILTEITGDFTQAGLNRQQYFEPIVALSEFPNIQAAESRMRELDQYLMHVLAEKGAEGVRLEIENDFPVLVEDGEKPESERNFGNAFRLARLIDAFHKVNLDQNLNFGMAVQRIIGTVTEDLGLPCRKDEILEGDQLSVKLSFDRDIGDFQIFDQGNDSPAYMIQTKYGGPRNDSKTEGFRGDVTGGTLCQHFIERVTAAALERKSLDPESFDISDKQIRLVREIPMHDRSRLGLLSPFVTQDSPGISKALN